MKIRFTNKTRTRTILWYCQDKEINNSDLQFELIYIVEVTMAIQPLYIHRTCLGIVLRGHPCSDQRSAMFLLHYFWDNNCSVWVLTIFDMFWMKLLPSLPTGSMGCTQCPWYHRITKTGLFPHGQVHTWASTLSCKLSQAGVKGGTPSTVFITQLHTTVGGLLSYFPR